MIIYKITNKINGKVYIGQTIRPLEKRIKQHKKSAGCGALFAAIQKYGFENFSIEQIDSASSIEELNAKEAEWIEKSNSLSPNGYNLSTGGKNKKWSEESKLRMSASHSGKKLSDKHKVNISNSIKKAISLYPEKFQKNTKAANEAVRKRLLAGEPHPKKGKKLSERAKQRISEAKKGKKNPMFGKKSNAAQLEAIKKGQQKRRDGLPKIKCHQNGKIYDSTVEAAADLSIGRSSVSNVLIGFRKSCKGYTFEYIERKSNEK